MSESRESLLETQLQKVLGRPNPPDFDNWRNRHPGAVAYLNHVVTSLVQRRRNFLVRVASTTSIAIVIVAAVFSISISQRKSFAQTLQAIDKAETITWTSEIFTRCTSLDGQRTWLRSEGRQEHAFKAPGLYRDTHFDNDGNITRIDIQNLGTRKSLTLDMKLKKATWDAQLSNQYSGSGPFESVSKILKSEPLELIGQRKINDTLTNVFRYQRETKNKWDQSEDFWIDAKTRQLVRISSPSVESSPDRDNPPEKQYSHGTIAGGLNDNIVFNARLDPNLFEMTPPTDFEIVQSPPVPTVTEQEMIEYLNVSAQFNDGVFVDTNRGVENSKYNTAEKKKKGDRTELEQRFLDLDSKHRRNHNRMPIINFVRENVVPGTFRYLGKGVKLGTTDRIVCWYKLKSTNTYRAVYGDLTVKDIDPKDLPLPIEE